MVFTLLPVFLTKMPLALKQWPQWELQGCSFSPAFQSSLAQHIIESEQGRTSWKLHGVWSSLTCWCWGRNWSLWRWSAHPISLNPSVFLPSHTSELGKHYPGHAAPQARSTQSSGEVGGQDYSSCAFPSLPDRRTSQDYSLPALVGCLNMDFLQRGVFSRCTLSCGRTVQVTTTF